MKRFVKIFVVTMLLVASLVMTVSANDKYLNNTYVMYDMEDETDIDSGYVDRDLKYWDDKYVRTETTRKFSMQFLHYGISPDSKEGQALADFRVELNKQLQWFFMTFKDENGKEYQIKFSDVCLYKSYIDLEPGKYTITKFEWQMNIFPINNPPIYTVNSEYLYTKEFIVTDNLKQIYIYVDIPRLFYTATEEQHDEDTKEVLRAIRPFCEAVYTKDGKPKKEYNHATDNVREYEMTSSDRYMEENGINPFTGEPVSQGGDVPTTEPTTDEVVTDDVIIIDPPPTQSPDSNDENVEVTQPVTDAEDDDSGNGNAFLNWLKNNALTLILIVGVFTALMIYTAIKKKKN